jgi:hypothetical protein
MVVDPDDELIASIAPDVMGRLDRSGFFEKLDDLLCPEDPSHSSAGCGGDSALSEPILRAAGFKGSDLADIFAVLRSKGGCCDCEILYNVAKPSRLKTEYWRTKAQELDAPARHIPGSLPETK